jgi:hypothetical protein
MRPQTALALGNVKLDEPATRLVQTSQGASGMEPRQSPPSAKRADGRVVAGSVDGQGS